MQRPLVGGNFEPSWQRDHMQPHLKVWEKAMWSASPKSAEIGQGPLRGFISWIVPCYGSPKYIVPGGINGDWCSQRLEWQRLEQLDIEEHREGLPTMQKGRVSKNTEFSVDRGNRSQRLHNVAMRFCRWGRIEEEAEDTFIASKVQQES